MITAEVIRGYKSTLCISLSTEDRVKIGHELFLGGAVLKGMHVGTSTAAESAESSEQKKSIKMNQADL